MKSSDNYYRMRDLELEDFEHLEGVVCSYTLRNKGVKYLSFSTNTNRKLEAGIKPEGDG